MHMKVFTKFDVQVCMFMFMFVVCVLACVCVCVSNLVLLPMVFP